MITRYLLYSRYRVLQALVREIAAYKDKIDELKGKADRLIHHNNDDPALRSQVNTELANVDDSYKALTATANQIKVRIHLG